MGNRTGLIVGCGYLGARVAQQWLTAGRDVFAVTRTSEHAAQLQRSGLRPIVADVTLPETLHGLPAAETVLYAVGHDRRGSCSRQQLYAGGLRAVLDALPQRPQRFLLISSTGVYGESGGDWVNEDTPCRPEREAGQAMLAAEQVLAQHALADRAIVLRLAGLYGPGRLPRAADLLAGRPVAVPSHGHLNLIHVDDAVQTILAAETRARPPRTYLIADGNPAGRRAFYTQLAALLGLPDPQFLEPQASDPAAVRARADKRVDNSRMLKELKLTLRYPSYREGLRAIVGGMRACQGFDEDPPDDNRAAS